MATGLHSNQLKRPQSRINRLRYQIKTWKVQSPHGDGAGVKGVDGREPLLGRDKE